MSATNLVSLIVGTLIVLQAGCCACAPSPAIPSVVQDKGLIKSESIDQKPLPAAVAASTISVPQQPLNSSPQQEPAKQLPIKVNSAEKLKRGLTNFVNQLTPGMFFVPSPVQHQTQLRHQKQSLPEDQQVGGVGSASSLGKELGAAKSSAQTSANKSDLANADILAEALIKRSNRMSQARSIGVPLRWG